MAESEFTIVGRKMRKRLIAIVAVLVFIVLSGVLFVVLQQGLTFATSPARSAGLAVVATPTPDITAAQNTANDALARAQDILNIVVLFATILGIVLTLLSVLAIGITFVGINSYRDVQATMKTLHSSVEEVKGQFTKTREALVNLGLADRLYSQNRMAEALDSYRKVGELLPEDVQVQYTLGRIYSGAGEYLSAISALEKANSLAHTQNSQNSGEQARIEKELGLAYRRKWEQLQDAESLEKALHYLQKSLMLNPQDSDTLAILGGLYRRKGAHSQARDHYLKAWRLNPALSYPIGNVASLCWYLNEIDDAQTYFRYTENAASERIKRGESEGAWDYYDLALAQLALKNTVEAKKTYQRAIQETKNITTFDGVLSNLHMLQQSPKAISGLDEIVRMVEDARTHV